MLCTSRAPSYVVFFFFQAEDGIRAGTVTGVQTCALPIFTGADRLLRLRWPCPVPGALPVSEVGDAVIGRGFGLMHDAGAEAAVDSAQHPWTLDNPAYGWFGLSSAARVRVGNEVRAVSVAEVVSPRESASAPLARGLMVALVRAGVTATCSSADK